MNLDFSALEKLVTRAGQRPGPGGEPTDPATHKLDGQRREREHIRQMYAEYQQNIQRTEGLRSDIAKGIQHGEDTASLLLKALECISVMTGDSVLYEQGKADLQAIYGWGFREPALLRRELTTARARLDKLTRAELTTPTGTKERIQGAITAHRKLIEALEQELTHAEAGYYEQEL